MLTSYDIAREWAAAMAADAALRAAFVDAYGKAPDIRVGYEPDNMPGEKDAPVIMLDPEGWKEPTEPATLHRISISVGVFDDAWMDVDGVRVLRGLHLLDAVFVRRVLEIIEDAVPDVHPDGVQVDYDPALFPLLYVDAAITIELRRPMGANR